MLTVLLALVLAAEYCNGQRRWAGSYSDTYSAEDTVTWDDRIYPRSDIPASTEANVRYRGKWPVDNWKEQDSFGTSSPPNPPARGVQYGTRTDEGSSVETSQEEKRIYQTPPEERPAPDEYNTREVVRPVVVNDREHRFSNNRKGDIPTVEEDQYSRHNIRRYKGDEGKASEVLPQERNQRRHLPTSMGHYGNREEEGRNYKGHEELPAVKIAADDMTRPLARDFAKPRDETKISVPEDHKNVPYYSGEPKREVPEVEESQTPRQERNNKGDVGGAYVPQDRGQERNQPKGDYDDKQMGSSVNYKGYGNVQGRYRPKDSEGELTAREYIRESQPKIVHDRDATDDRQNKGDRKGNKHVYGSEVSTSRYNRSIMEPTQGSEERFMPTPNGHRYVGNSEDRAAAREYDSRREEELKQREYERRLEEEMKKRQDETRNFNTKGAEDQRREGGPRGSESGRKGQPVRGMGHKEERDMKPEEPGKHREHGGESEIHRTDTNRNFETGRDSIQREEIGEESYRAKGEERSGDPVYIRRENGRRHPNVKGNIYVSTEGRLTIVRGVVRDSREQTKMYNSERTQNGRTEGNQYNGRAKGETYNMESDYSVKNLNYNLNSSQPGVYRNDGQRTTNRTFDGKHLPPVAVPANGHHRRQGNDRVSVHSVVQSSSNSMVGIRGNGENQTNGERGQHNASNQHGSIDSNQKAVYVRNPEQSADRDFKSTSTPSYAEADGHQTRRAHSSREGYISSPPNYNKEEKNADSIGSDVRQNRPVDETRSHSSYPSAANDRRNNEQPIKSNNTSRQRATNSWKTDSNSREVYGYHPNVSYDTIVFLDDRSDDEDDVWNLSNQKREEPPTHANPNQDEHKSQSRVPATRENRRNVHYRINVTSSATQFRRRNRRAPTGYPTLETKTGAQQPEEEDTEGIHPDVVLLPGYTFAKPFSRRNYNDDVMDSEVEIFSEREIRVSSRDYKRYGASFFSVTAAGESESNNNSPSVRKTG